MSNKQWTKIIIVLVIVIFAILVDIPRLPSWVPGYKWFSDLKVHLGLDLQGGIHLIYETDTTNIPEEDKEYAVEGARDVIEKRVNVFGVGEPQIQTAKTGSEWRIIVELPGISDVGEALEIIGQTPTLEFREPGDLSSLTEEQISSISSWVYTGLSGQQLKMARLSFDQQNRPQVSLEFNEEGTKLFKEITERNIGKPVAIFLDGAPLSIPTVQEVIPSGQAVITGDFSITEAKELAERLAAGALPVPIKLISQQHIGPTLGKISLEQSFFAGLLGLILVMVFMIYFYKGKGVCASLALIIYCLINLAIFKLIPVTLTLAGIAGFILSIGMAVDANILIFERIKDEEEQGKNSLVALNSGFRHAWTAIRDSNITTLIVCFILYEFGTGLIRGFGLTLGIGVAVSMFSALTITRIILEIFYQPKIKTVKV